MIETFTSAVCGSRRRQRIGIALFTVGAVAASAVLGAVLALAGAYVGARAAVVAIAALAALAALREAGALRFPLPQLRLQVPEHWRFELPLPVWTTGYGAGLGLGVMTYQPVATFWVACAGALALGRPLAAAACFSLYGLGRAATLVLPRRRRADATLVVERLARRRQAVRRANVVVLAVCAALLAAAPVAGAAVLNLGPGSQLDPTLSDGVLAYTQRDAGVNAVVVLAPSAPVRYEAAESPALDGDLLAYTDPAGIRVVRWRTGEEVARITDLASKPALEWPLLAYRLDLLDGWRQLMLANLETGELRVLARVRTATDLGRPSMSRGRIAWHVANSRGSRVVVYTIETRTRRVLASSKIALFANPSLGGDWVLWTHQRSGRSAVRLRNLHRTKTVTLAATARRELVYWTTGVTPGDGFVTRWSTATGRARILQLPF